MESCESVDNWFQERGKIPMTKKEKIVKKIHGLMTKWGVTPEELDLFGEDLDAELEDNDFEDDVEQEVAPDVDGEVTPEPQEKGEVDVPPVDEGIETQPEQDQEELGEPEKEVDYDAKFDELLKANEGLLGRIEALEEIVSKLGEPKKDESFGETATAETTEDGSGAYFEQMKALREGRR